MSKKIEIKPSKNAVTKIKEKKITHAYFHDKYLKKIPKFTNGLDLLVIYLHNNEIFEISGLENTTNLMSLYLQKNRIQKIENLQTLRRLRKLYLGHNMISVVEGLENLENLEELHLEKQFLYEGNSLCFDPRSILGISHSLQLLNISHNKIQTISSLASLKFLKVLNASYNELSNIEEICEIIKEWFYLKDVSFANNPICKSRLYQEDIISSAYCLELLDQKTVSDHTRNFLKRLHGERIADRLHKPVNLTEKIPDLPKNYSSAIHKAVSISVLKQKDLCGENTEIFDEKNAVYIPWNTLPKPQTVSKLHLLVKNRTDLKKRRTSNKNHSFSDLKI